MEREPRLDILGRSERIRVRWARRYTDVPPYGDVGRRAASEDQMNYLERLEEFAELNGSYGRCPRCHRRVWTESACAFECLCGYTDADEFYGRDDEPEVNR